MHKNQYLEYEIKTRVHIRCRVHNKEQRKILKMKFIKMIQWTRKVARCILHWKTNHVPVKSEQPHESWMERDELHSPNGSIHDKDDNTYIFTLITTVKLP